MLLESFASDGLMWPSGLQRQHRTEEILVKILTSLSNCLCVGRVCVCIVFEIGFLTGLELTE